MLQQDNAPRYLVRWDYNQLEQIDQTVVEFSHRLRELSELSVEAIEDTVNRYPSNDLIMSHTGNEPSYPSQLQFGDIGKISGHELIKCLSQGSMSLRIRNLCKNDHPLDSTIQRLRHELVECQPGLRLLSHEGDLHVSSPRSQSYFSTSFDHQVIWQVQGRSTVLTYPQELKFIRDISLESIASGQRFDHHYFEPRFDEYATVTEIEPGQAITIPSLTPFRIVHGNLRVVALRTCHATADSLQAHRVYRANRLLRAYLPGCFRGHSRLERFMKSKLIEFVDRMKRHSFEPYRLKDDQPKTFTVDPTAKKGVRWLTDYSVDKIRQDQLVVSPKLSPTVATATTLES